MRYAVIVALWLSGCAGEAIVKFDVQYDDSDRIVNVTVTEARRVVRP